MRGIYKLNFSGTHKVYIGQAESIERRFSEHCYTMKKEEAAKKLQAAYNLYGRPTYEVLCEILTGSMDDTENEAIEIFNAVADGFNTFSHEGGSIRSQSGLDHSNSKYSKREILRVFSLLYRTTLPYRVVGLKSRTNQYLVANIVQGGHRWLKDEYPQQYLLMQLKCEERKLVNTKSVSSLLGSVPKIKSPTGEVLEVPNIRQFCISHADLARNIESSRSCIAKVLRNKKPSHLGWTLP